MMLLDFCVVLLSLGVGTQTPQSSEPTAESASEILARLSELAREQSCTVVYQLTKKGEAERMRIVYRAPDQMKLELHLADGAATCWVLKSRWVVHAECEQDSYVVDIDPSRLSAPAKFEAAANEFFPPSELGSSYMSPGCFLSMKLHPDKPLSDDKYLEFELAWDPYRKHPLSWFAQSKRWSDARVEQELLVVDYPSGARASLSRSSGWPQELMHPAGSRLSLVEFSTQVDEDEFVIPTPREGWRDATQEWIQWWPKVFFMNARSRIYVTASRVAQAGEREPELLQHQLTQLFEILYEPEVERRFKPWVVRASANIDDLTQRRVQRLKVIGDDPTLRAEYEQWLAKQIAEYGAMLAEAGDQYSEQIPMIELASVSKELALEFHAAEQAGARAAFQSAIAAPIKAELAASLE
jgi:hypothetical protein